MNAHETEDQELRRVALAYQAQLQIWKRAVTEAEQAQCRRALEPLQDQLYALMLPHLHRIAGGWINSSVSTEFNSIVMNLFAHMVDRMIRADLTKATNMRSFLGMLAWRGYADQHDEEKPLSFGLDPAIAEQRVTAFDPDLADGRIDNQLMIATIVKFWQTHCSPIDHELGRLVMSGFSGQEIAERLKISYANVRKRLSRLRVRTREYLVAQALIASDAQV